MNLRGTSFLGAIDIYGFPQIHQELAIATGSLPETDFSLRYCADGGFGPVREYLSFGLPAEFRDGEFQYELPKQPAESEAARASRLIAGRLVAGSLETGMQLCYSSCPAGRAAKFAAKALRRGEPRIQLEAYISLLPIVRPDIPSDGE